MAATPKAIAQTMQPYATKDVNYYFHSGWKESLPPFIPMILKRGNDLVYKVRMKKIVIAERVMFRLKATGIRNSHKT